MLFGNYFFSCELVDDAILPSYKGSTFRGVFGHTLKRVVCSLKKQECAECLLKEKCVYAFVFETQGKETTNALLLSPKDGKYYQYLKEYKLDQSKIDFGFDNVHTIKNKNGVEIDDIVDEDENELLLKKCLELTFQFSGDSKGGKTAL